MIRATVITLSIVLTLVLGCTEVAFVGDPDLYGGGSNDGDPDARVFFDANVQPLLEAHCANCHQGTDGPQPKFLGPSAAAYYNALTGDDRMVNDSPTTSLLVTYGEHAGPAWEPSQQSTVVRWLELEAGLIDPGQTDPSDPRPKTLASALERFGACMDLGIWNDTGMPDLADQNTTQGPCYSCHSTGTAAAYLNMDGDMTFESNRYRPFVLKLVISTVNPDGTFADLVPAYRFADKGNEPCNLDEACHPEYLLSSNREDALMSFVDRTMEKYHDYATDCGELPAK